jgi:hypothetical protein
MGKGAALYLWKNKYKANYSAEPKLEVVTCKLFIGPKGLLKNI